MAKAAEIRGLDASMATATAAAAIVEVRAGEVAAHAHDVLDVGDIERVHDMRVATRRLRAALETFEVCFPKKVHALALEQVKELADALGERRDRDVTIAALDEFSEGLAAPDRPGVESLVAVLRREQSEANEDLAPYVSEERITELREEMEHLAAAARELVEDELEAEAGTLDAATLATASVGNGAGAASGNWAGERPA